jgi:DNA-binding MarR family transcriptional regulator
MEKSVQGVPQWSRVERGPREIDVPPGIIPDMLNRQQGEVDASGNAPSSEEHGFCDTTIGYLVRDAHRSLVRSLQSRIAIHGVSMGQWFFLRALWDEDGLTQRELSQRVGMMEPTTVTALNGMERRGLVQRVRNVRDRRKVNIFLTPRGRALREVLMPCSIEVSRDATEGVSKVELAIAMDVLRRMVANLTGAVARDELGADVEDDALGVA